MAAFHDQATAAQSLYDDRSIHYDDSWHPKFAKNIVQLADIRPGEHVLDLACGTGLVTLLARDAVGPTGSVIGIDVSSGMLNQAQIKLKESKDAEQSNIEFHLHSVTDLPSLEPIQGKTFDCITCASALVLLPDPAQAVRQWSAYLRPGGRIVVDVTHPLSQLGPITFERVGRRLKRPVPWYRSAFQIPDDLSVIMQAAGLNSPRIQLIAQLTSDTDLQACLYDVDRPRISQTYSVSDADSVFNRYLSKELVKTFGDVIDDARLIFKEEWSSLADEHGIIQEVDGVFVAVATKP